MKNSVVSFIIGDWSEDGHMESETFYISMNIAPVLARAAYLETCKKLGLSLEDINQVGLAIDWEHPEHNARQICADYNNKYISALATSILKENGFDVNKYHYTGTEPDDGCLVEPSVDGLLALYMDFIKFSRPEFEWELTESNVLSWNDSFRCNVGYGLFK